MRCELGDHAVLRHIERVDNVDVEKARQQITEDLTTRHAQQLIGFGGRARFKLRKGKVTYCFKRGVLVTCY